MTKGIVKIPPGSVNRWKAIADYVGTKTMKEVIAKAKEIQEKQRLDVEAKREAAQDTKEMKAQFKKEALAEKKKMEEAEK